MSRPQLIYFLVALLVPFGQAAPESLEEAENSQFIAGEILRSLSGAIVRGYENKHSLAQNCSCSFHACSNVLDHQEICTDRLGAPESCGGACQSRKVSLEYSYVTTPPNSDPGSLSPLVIEESCIYQDLDEVFRNYESQLYSWVYFGMAGGVTINYPGVPSARGLTDPGSDPLLGNCEQYDPRVRPWYLDATSAPKDLIILIDASSSMSKGAGPTTMMTRWELAKKVANTVIDLMHFADAVNVMILGEDYFNTTVPTLREASDENKEILHRLLEDVEPSGEKMTEEGLAAAFLTFRRAQSQQIRSTNCQKVILWITDGQICTAASTHHHCSHEHEYLHELLHNLEEEQDTLETSSVRGKATIFVATVGDGSATKLARHVACTNNGTWMNIRPGYDILEQLHSYSSFFAVQLKENERLLLWSRFYEDFTGQGTMTTATHPVFSLGTHGPRRGKLLGVIGVDIPLNRLAENGLRYEEVVGSLAQGIGQCNVYPIDHCQLQILREAPGECPNIHPVAQCYEDEKSGHVYYSTYKTEDHWTFNEAKRACRRMNGRLAEIESLDEQSLLSGLSSFDGSWIGLQKLHTSDSWEWLSGRERDFHFGEHFWSTSSVTMGNEDYCAAIDSRGTRKNVDARHCDDGLHLLCEFDSADEAQDACQGDIHVIELNTENQIPSIEYCLRDEGGARSIDDSEFLMLRTRENGAPVFCPMNLDEPLSSADAQCCDTCLSSDLNALTGEVNDDDESDAVPLNAHFVFVFLNFLLSLFLLLL